MSCKLARPDSVQPFSLPGARPARETPQQPAAGMPPDDRRVAELHGRLADLEQALQRDVRQAHEAGRREGEKAGLERATAELQPVIDRMSHAVAELAGLKAKLRREAEHDLVKLALAIARRVLRRELAVDPEAVQGLIKAALEKVQAREVCRVRLHPDYQAQVRRYLERTGATGIEIVADGALSRGDLLVDTKQGELDCSIDTQLSEIERGFADRLGR